MTPYRLQVSRLLPMVLLAALLIAQLAAVRPTLANDVTDVPALVNQKRTEAGLQPLVLCATLSLAAQNHSNDMAARGYFSHDSPDKPPLTMRSRIEAAGYNGWTNIAENIALGQETPQQVFDSWWNSPGHHDNIMNPAYQHMGLGTARGSYQGKPDRKFWTQTFGAGGNCGGDMVDLSVTVTDNPDPVVASRDLTYNITISNNSTPAADGSLLDVRLPAGVAFIAATPEQGNCAASGQTISCNLGSINTNSRTAVTVITRPSAAATITTTVSISTSDTDMNPANNSASVNTVVLPGPPTPPILTSPLGAYTGNQPVFQWTASPGAVRYEFQYGTSGTPDSTPVSVASTAYILPAPLLPATYSWRVRAFNAAGTPSDNWSKTGTVTIESAVTDAPFRGYYTSQPFSLTWSPVSWATAYEIQIYAHPTVVTVNDIRQQVDKNKLSFEVLSLPVGIYYWRVCAKNAAGTCLWSPAERIGVTMP